MGLFQKAVDRVVSDKVPHKQRKRLIIFIALITVLSMVTSTVAWFTVNTFAGVQVFELHISTADDLRVAMENLGPDITKYTHVITDFIHRHIDLLINSFNTLCFLVPRFLYTIITIE